MLSVFAGRTCLMFVVFLRRMMSTLQWSRPETNVSSQTTCCLSVTLLRQSVARKCLPAKFLCVTQRVAWCVACGTEHEAYHGAYHGTDMSAYSRDLLRLIPGHPSASVKQKSVAYHPCIESVTYFCCLGPGCTHNSRGTLGSHFADGSGAGGYSTLIHGSTS